MSGLAMRPLSVGNPDPDAEPSRLAGRLIITLGLMLMAMLVWAAFAELDVATRAKGAVTPPSKLQELQSLEGGIVEEVLVSEGETVRRGQVLVRLDTTQTESDLGEARQQQLAAVVARARYDALLNGSTPRFDAAWQSEAPELIRKELELWRDGLREYQSTQAVLREGVQRRRNEVAEAESRLASLTGNLKVAEEAYAIEERLNREGAGSRADLLAARQRLMTQRTEIDGVRQSLPRLRAGLAEVRAQLTEADARARAQWGALRSEAEAKAATLGAGLVAKRDRVARRELTAPMDGIVNRILVNTRGGVVGPGKPILEIVPVEEKIILTARVNPADIGFVHVGQQAHVRVLPYDAATHGQMDAVVERVGADALQNEKGEAYFEVQLSAARGQIKLHDKPLPINPGMPVDVGILTGERTVLQYLMKPVLRGVQGALQER